MRKILIGLVLVGSLVSGGNIAPAWVEKYRTDTSQFYFSDEEIKSGYRDAYMNNCMYLGVQQIKENDDKSYTYKYIHHGQYDASIYSLTNGIILKKIVIKQKIPCYVAVKGWDKAKGFLENAPKERWLWTYQIKNSKAVYKGNGVTEVYKGACGLNGQTNATLISKRIRVLDSKKVIPERVELIAGDSLSCLDEPNEETWTVYWFLKGKWVAVAKENMGKISDNLRK